jgi:hypothetical protein
VSLRSLPRTMRVLSRPPSPRAIGRALFDFSIAEWNSRVKPRDGLGRAIAAVEQARDDDDIPALYLAAIALSVAGVRFAADLVDRFPELLRR